MSCCSSSVTSEVVLEGKGMVFFYTFKTTNLQIPFVHMSVTYKCPNIKTPQLDHKCYVNTGTSVFLIKKAFPTSCLDFVKQSPVGARGEIHQA